MPFLQHLLGILDMGRAGFEPATFGIKRTAIRTPPPWSKRREPSSRLPLTAQPYKAWFSRAVLARASFLPPSRRRAGDVMGWYPQGRRASSLSAARERH